MELPKIKLPPIDKKYKLLGVVGIIALFSNFYYDYIYKSHAQKAEALLEELKDLNSKIEIIQTIEYPGDRNIGEILRKIEYKKNSYLAKITEAEAKLPSKENFSFMLEKITHLANEADFEIKSLGPKEFKIKEAYGTMVLEIDINTRFENLYLFFEKIKELPVMPELLSIAVNKRPNISVRLNLAILFK
ncbi:MAG: type 4a pilus biogenesis protein PilO [Candidatus Omnitrophica bacterium]|nr:type 4a pilus biogenesis protein PilO [Candidatus Omnitrophota bacterium]